jgi:DNA polymerase/3'-5' exonuclease PolX
MLYFTGSKEHNIKLRTMAGNVASKSMNTAFFDSAEMACRQYRRGYVPVLDLHYISLKRLDSGEIEKPELPEFQNFFPDFDHVINCCLSFSFMP